MDLKVINELVNLMGNSKLSSLEIEEKDFRVKLEKKIFNNGESDSNINKTIKLENTFENNNYESSGFIEEEIKEIPEKIESTDKLLENKKVIKAPIVGTFYSSPSPDSPAFAEVGKKIKIGQILCIIEAMKLMNEIESEFDGEIKDILVANGEMVEYGQPLMVIQ